MEYLIGALVGAAIVMLIPPKYEDQMRVWIINQWQKFTKKG